MPQTTTYLDGNWNVVSDENKAAFRLVTTTDDDGNVIMKQRESLGERKGKQTYSTDPRAGAIMREGNHGTPMSRPNGH